MQTYITLLRGINVGGSKMIKMEALRELFTGLGFTSVVTYIQSGNIVFQSPPQENHVLEVQISNKIYEVFSFNVPVMVRKLEELREIVENNPFLIDQSKNESFLHITLLSNLPAQQNIDKLVENQYSGEDFVLNRNVVYLYCPNGYGNTKLNNTYFENKLKVTATTRNWKTTKELLNIANDLTPR